jgi:hypothetical protein
LAHHSLEEQNCCSGLCWDDPDFEAEDVALVTATFTIDSYSTGRQFTFILVELCGEKYKRKGISEAWVESSADIEEWLGNQVKQNIVLV